MSIHLLLVFLALTASFATADKEGCFDAKKLSEEVKAKGIREKCKTEIKSQSQTDDCFNNFRLCDLRELELLNHAKEVDHEKTVSLLQKFSKDDDLSTRLSPCNKNFEGDKITKYFDCIQEHCAEITDLRTDFRRYADKIC